MWAKAASILMIPSILSCLAFREPKSPLFFCFQNLNLVVFELPLDRLSTFDFHSHPLHLPSLPSLAYLSIPRLSSVASLGETRKLRALSLSILIWRSNLICLPSFLVAFACRYEPSFSLLLSLDTFCRLWESCESNPLQIHLSCSKLSHVGTSHEFLPLINKPHRCPVFNHVSCYSSSGWLVDLDLQRE